MLRDGISMEMGFHGLSAGNCDTKACGLVDVALRIRIRVRQINHCADGVVAGG